MTELDLAAIRARMADPRYSREFLADLALRDLPALVNELEMYRAEFDITHARFRATLAEVETLRAKVAAVEVGR